MGLDWAEVLVVMAWGTGASGQAVTAGVMKISGEALLGLWAKSREVGSWFVIRPAVEEGKIEKERMYRVAMPAMGIWTFAQATHSNPESLRMVEGEVGEGVRGVMEGNKGEKCT